MKATRTASFGSEKIPLLPAGCLKGKEGEGETYILTLLFPQEPDSLVLPLLPLTRTLSSS